MDAEIITIGDEILIGQVIDTNSAWIAQKLNAIGINLVQISSISDKNKDIIVALDHAKERADIVIITGGLGPTKDDITKETLCEYFETELKLNEEVLKNVENYFESKGLQTTKINRDQALLPASCKPLKNNFGTAQGMWFEKNGKVFVSLPGVPYEMKFIMEDSVIPMLSAKINTGNILHKSIMTTGIGESFIAEKLSEVESNLPENIKLAYLPKPGIVRLRLSGTGNDKSSLETSLNNCSQEIENILSKYVYGYDDEKLEEVIGKLLNERKETISTAESCTGGYISHLITSIPGSSNYYKGSAVVYSNDIKEKILSVNNETLKKHGAVSEQTVIEMAKSVRDQFNTTYSIACSGIAGPDGGTEEKPVGTVWTAVATPKEIITKKFLFESNRERNIEKTAIACLNLLRKFIIND
ncbi:competence/damage-inducible protein A [Cytophagaceae bacterium AH-315-L13]|nr:competence/damage-inducible protein A [Cytophagaceae bacterium AH-315-L13]